MRSDSFQWRLFRAKLDPALGSEQAGTRPVLVVSREVINQALPIVAVVPLTSMKAGRRIYATEVLLPAGAAGQPDASIRCRFSSTSTDRVARPFVRLAQLIGVCPGRYAAGELATRVGGSLLGYPPRLGHGQPAAGDQ